MKDIEKFIEFVNDLTTELYYDSLRVNGEYIYTHGGCLTFIKIMNQFINIEDIYINDTSDHCAFMYDNLLYDSLGIIKNEKNYKKATNEDIVYMSDKFGGHISDRKIFETVMGEMNKIENIPFIDKNPRGKHLVLQK